MVSVALCCLAALAALQVAAAKVADYPLPPYVEKACHRKDPKFEECLTEVGAKTLVTISKGDPKYRIPQNDPFVIPELRIKQGSKQIGIDFICTNCSLIGLKDAKFLKSKTDFDKKKAAWNFYLKNLAIRGKYSITGKVLLLPITGSGDADINIKDLNLEYKFVWDLIKKSNGKEYIRVNNFTIDQTVGGLTLDLKNLFNGDKLLGDNMNNFLNENWKELVEELGPAVSEALGGILKAMLNAMGDLIPYDTLFPA